MLYHKKVKKYLHSKQIYENYCVFDCSPAGSEGSCNATLEGSTLTISGTGAIKNYDFSYSGEYGLPTSKSAPWFQDVFAKQKNIIKKKK